MTALMARSKNCAGASVEIAHCNNSSGAERMKEQILNDLPVKEVRLHDCRGLNSLYAMEKGIIIGY